jgi:hypothetical protein
MSAWTCHEITNPLQLDVDIQSLILPTSLGFGVIYSIRETTTRIFIESNFFHSHKGNQTFVNWSLL